MNVDPRGLHSADHWGLRKRMPTPEERVPPTTGVSKLPTIRVLEIRIIRLIRIIYLYLCI